MADEMWWQRLAEAKAAGLQAFKLGTEEEGLDAEEVRFLAGLIPQGTGLMLKIGGPCARADLRLAAAVRATAVVAPMVESPFALRRFIEACDLDLGPANREVARAFNLETKFALQGIDALMAIPEAKRLNFVNIGRSDLAASLGLAVGDPVLHELVAGVIAKLRDRNLPVHVGGQVTAHTLLPLLQRVQFQAFHTRFLVFAVENAAQTEAAIHSALSLEILLLERLASQFADRADAHRHRAAETERRLTD